MGVLIMNDKMLAALNEQVNKEFYSAYLYLGMAVFFEQNNLKGFANWMRVQSREETTHAMKIYDYILSRGGEVSLSAIDAPQQDWSSPIKVFIATYEHEKKVTQMINNLVKLADEVNDYAARAFLMWFVTEQVEEEANASEILEKLKLAGDSSGLLFLDAELSKRQIVEDTA
jgi:ferritin